MEISKEKYLQLYNKIDWFEKNKSIKSQLIYGKKNSKAPLITIIIPTYKREDLLKEAIESVLNQKNDFDDYDIIVLDNSADFSTENKTRQLIETIASDKILFYINEQNLGQAGNWNRGFELADGKYAALLHDDDLVSPDYFDVIVKDVKLAESKTNKFGCMRGAFVRFSKNSEIDNFEIEYKNIIREYKKYHSLFSGIGPTGCPSCGMLFNPRAVIEVGGFNQDFYPAFDYILGYLLLRKQFKVFLSETVYGFYRVGINESMKRENLINFCKCDYYFREFMYSENIFKRLFGLLFRDVQYKKSIAEIRNLARQFKQNISLEELKFAPGYKPTLVRTFLFDTLKSFFDFNKHHHNIINYLKNVRRKILAENWRRKQFSKKYTFLNNSKKSKSVCFILAGYKEFTWAIVFKRIKKYIPDDIDVCIVSPGKFVDKLKDIAVQNKWSYLSLKENQICKALNTAISLFPGAESIFKIDEDIFITDGFFDNLPRVYERAKDKYSPAFVAPMLNINGFCYRYTLEKYKLLDYYENKFDKALIGGLLNTGIEQDPEVAKFFWGKGNYLPNIDEMNKDFHANPINDSYLVCPIRFSIGAIYFKRDLLETYGYFPPCRGNGLGVDEVHICNLATAFSQAIIIAPNQMVGHLSFKNQNKAMEKYFKENTGIFEIHN